MLGLLQVKNLKKNNNKNMHVIKTFQSGNQLFEKKGDRDVKKQKLINFID